MPEITLLEIMTIIIILLIIISMILSYCFTEAALDHLNSIQNLSQLIYDREIADEKASDVPCSEQIITAGDSFVVNDHIPSREVLQKYGFLDNEDTKEDIEEETKPKSHKKKKGKKKSANNN